MKKGSARYGQAFFFSLSKFNFTYLRVLSANECLSGFKQRL